MFNRIEAGTGFQSMTSELATENSDLPNLDAAKLYAEAIEVIL